MRLALVLTAVVKQTDASHAATRDLSTAAGAIASMYSWCDNIADTCENRALAAVVPALSDVVPTCIASVSTHIYVCFCFCAAGCGASNC